MPRKPKEPKIDFEIIGLDLGLPCGFDCPRTAMLAFAKPLRRKKRGSQYVRPWEILPVCDLHFKLINRDVEVTQRMKELEQEEGKE